MKDIPKDRWVIVWPRIDAHPFVVLWEAGGVTEQWGTMLYGYQGDEFSFTAVQIEAWSEVPEPQHRRDG